MQKYESKSCRGLPSKVNWSEVSIVGYRVHRLVLGLRGPPTETPVVIRVLLQLAVGQIDHLLEAGLVRQSARPVRTAAKRETHKTPARRSTPPLHKPPKGLHFRGHGRIEDVQVVRGDVRDVVIPLLAAIHAEHALRRATWTRNAQLVKSGAGTVYFV